MRLVQENLALINMSHNDAEVSDYSWEVYSIILKPSGVGGVVAMNLVSDD
jgi:hypothetical protein